MILDDNLGGSGPLGGGTPSSTGQKIQFLITEAELVDGLRRVKFYWPLVEQMLQQVPFEDVPYLTAYLAAAVTAQDKEGAVVITAFTSPFTEYYKALLAVAVRDRGITPEPGVVFMLEPAEEDLKGGEEEKGIIN